MFDIFYDNFYMSSHLHLAGFFLVVKHLIYLINYGAVLAFFYLQNILFGTIVLRIIFVKKN